MFKKGCAFLCQSGRFVFLGGFLFVDAGISGHTCGRLGVVFVYATRGHKVIVKSQFCVCCVYGCVNICKINYHLCSTGSLSYKTSIFTNNVTFMRDMRTSYSAIVLFIQFIRARNCLYILKN